jgi:GTP pyrophosphokinase
MHSSTRQQLHRDQVRKGSGVPYVSHLLGVGLAGAGGRRLEDEGIAALLHDAAEDQVGRAPSGGDRGTVRRLTSPASSAPAATPSRRRSRRGASGKERYLEHLEAATPDELACRWPTSSTTPGHPRRPQEIGERVWTRFKPDADSLWYYRRVADLFTRRLPGRMAGELEIVVAEIERRTAAARPPIPDSYWVQPAG